MCRVDRASRRRTAFFVADDCHPQTIAVVRDARRAARASRSVVGDAREICDFDEPRLFGVLRPVPDDRRRDRRLLARFVERAHAAGALVVVATDLLALTLLDAARRARRRHRRRLGAALRRAAGLRRPARGVLRDAATSTRASMPGRIVGVSKDAHGKPALSPGAADARAAHPPREGDEQHLHGAGAARGDGRDVRRLPRARGAAADRAARARARRARSRAGCARLGFDGRGATPFFDTLRVRTDAAARPRDRSRAPRERGINLRDYRRRHRRRRARRDDDADRRRRRCSRRSPAGSCRSRVDGAGREPSRRCPRRSRARARSSTHPVFNTPPRRARDAALHLHSSRRATSRSRTR